MKWDGTNYIYTRVNGTEHIMEDPFPSLTRKYWNTNTPWNLEQKITWDEIAPSLQELIIESHKIEWDDLGPGLQGRIIDAESNKDTIDDEIDDRITADNYLQDQINVLVNQVTTITNRITTVEGTVLSIQNYINTEIKPELINLSNRIDILDTYIEEVWGSELYRNNHEHYNIYQLWQQITDILNRLEILESAEDLSDEIIKIWGNTTYHNNHIQYNIYEIWQKINDILNRISILEGGPDWSSNITDYGTRITNLEYNVERIWNHINRIWNHINNLETDVEELKNRPVPVVYIDQVITSNGDPDFRFFVHFSNNWCIQSFYSGSCRSNISFETIQTNGYQYYDPNNDANTRHGYITQTINPHKEGSEAYNRWQPGRKLFGTVRKIPYEMKNSDYIVLHASDETANGTYGLPDPYLSTDQHSVTCIRRYDETRILCTTVFIDKEEEDEDILNLGYSGPEIQENGSIIIIIGEANRVQE